MSRSDNTAPAAVAEVAPVATEATVTPEAATPATEATVTDSTVTDAPVTTPADATPEATPATPAAPVEPTDEEKAAAAAADKANQDTFDAALQAAIDAHDSASGDVPSELSDAVKTAYRSLNTTQKRQSRDAIQASLQTALGKELNAAKARAYMDLGEALKSTKAVSDGIATPKVDPTTAYVEGRLALYFSGEFLPAPSDLAADWASQMKAKAEEIKGSVATVKAYLAEKAAWDATDTHAEGTSEPSLSSDVPSILVQALKIAQGGKRTATARKATGTTTPRVPRTSSLGAGRRGNIAAHIEEWAKSVPVGTVAKHGAVAKFASTGYPDANASTGAIGAFMDRANFGGIQGVTIAGAELDGNKAIKRTA